jgi:MFS family permease
VTGLWTNRAFARLWAAGLFSELAEWMLQVALPVWIYQATGSPGSTALAMVAGLLPTVLFSPVAGVLADRWDRRRTLFGVCLAQALVAVPLLTVTSAGDQVVIYLVLVAQSVLATVFEPTRNALVPALVPAEQLTAANGLMGFNSSVARLAGSSVGGVVLGLGGLGWVVGGYVLAMLLATASLLPSFGAITRPVATPQREPIVRAWIDGLAEFRRERRLRVTGAAPALALLGQGMFMVLFVVFVTGPLAGGEAEVGLLRGIQAIGGLAAGVLVATTTRQVAPETLLGGGALSLGLASVVIWNLPAVTTNDWVYIGLFAAVGAPAVCCTSGALTVMQTSAAPERVWRVLATAFAGMAGFQTAGALAAGALAGVCGLGLLLNVQGALIITGGLVALIGLRRDVRRRPGGSGSHRRRGPRGPRGRGRSGPTRPEPVPTVR